MTLPTNSSSGDGRNVDPRLGELAGEAAEQAVPQRRSGAGGSAPFDVWRNRSGTTVGYYERPLLKEPVWIWAVPAYFVVGGAAGGAALIAAAAQAADGHKFERLIAGCRVVAVGGTVAGTGFLIYDLGRPERFLNMLRVFRPTSAMSMGSWLLAASAASDFTALLLSRSAGVWQRLGRAAGAAAGVFGLPLAGYTGVLLSDTAVPLWRAMRTTLSPLFLISGMSCALALVNLGSLSDDERKVIGRLGRLMDVAELAVTIAAEREAKQIVEVGVALEEGPGARMWKISSALTVGTLAMSLLPGGGRAVRSLQAAVGVAGSWAMKAGVFEAGRASARDPRALFEQQKAQLQATERP
jgi:formate-dependent nitrite reductase membrane component NrfD